MAIQADAPNVTIASGTSVSDAIRLDEAHNLSIWLPSSWTAATLALQVARGSDAPSAGDWRTVCDQDGEIALPAAANRVILVPASTMLPNGARWLRLVSGTAASQVTQAGARVISVERRSF